VTAVDSGVVDHNLNDHNLNDHNLDDASVVEPRRIYPRASTTAWLGVLGITGLAVWLGAVGLRELLHAGDLASALAAARDNSVGPAVLVVAAVLLLAELAWPATRRPLFARAHLVDATYLLVFALVVLPLLTVIETGFDIEVSDHAGFLILSRLSIAPQIAFVAVILLGMDAMNWAAHVSNHRYLTLWRLHAVHHSQEEMGVLTTFRVHPLVHVSYLPSVIPVLILGASGTVPAAALIAYGCFVMLAHANLRFSFGPLQRVLVSPAYHRLHHVAVPVDERGSVNFGFVLVCWDQLFHRAVYPKRDALIVTGIKGRPVPVEQAGRALEVPRVILAQVVQPFRLHAATDGQS
jgi:sterol desaturase/sphingolipid hydroxylase (fatty acid hydroxylase superfamily)